MALFLALAMFLCSLPVSAAGGDWLVPKMKEYLGFADVTGTWCESYVETVCRAGLMTGKTAERFDAVSPLTYAQITVITARLHALLNGGDGVLPAPGEGEAWYQPAADYLKTHCDDDTLLYLVKELERGTDRPNAACGRGHFVWMLAGVLPESALAPVNSVSIVPDSTDADVLKFYQAGILGGSDAYGTFDAAASLTRGAAAAMLARIIDPSQRLTFTLQPFDLCRDVLGVAPDTPLLTVDGQPVAAELFAYQLCTSLLQWEGTADRAVSDATRFWCDYYAPFQVLAEEKSVALSEEKLAEIAAEAQASAGLYGTTAAYQQFHNEGLALNLALRDLYIEQDWKWGEGDYHSDLQKVSDALLQKTVPTDALKALDFRAVYHRLKTSPFAAWRF